MVDIPGQETDYERDEYKQDEEKQEDNYTEPNQQRPDDLLNNDPNKSYENTTFNPPPEPPERDEHVPGQTEQVFSDPFDKETEKKNNFENFFGTPIGPLDDPELFQNSEFEYKALGKGSTLAVNYINYKGEKVKNCKWKSY